MLSHQRQRFWIINMRGKRARGGNTLGRKSIALTLAVADGFLKCRMVKADPSGCFGSLGPHPGTRADTKADVSLRNVPRNPFRPRAIRAFALCLSMPRAIRAHIRSWETWTMCEWLVVAQYLVAGRDHPANQRLGKIRWVPVFRVCRRSQRSPITRMGFSRIKNVRRLRDVRIITVHKGRQPIFSASLHPVKWRTSPPSTSFPNESQRKALCRIALHTIASATPQHVDPR